MKPLARERRRHQSRLGSSPVPCVGTLVAANWRSHTGVRFLRSHRYFDGSSGIWTESTASRMNGAMQAHSSVAASCRQCDAQHAGVHELASEDKLGQPSGRPNPHVLCSSSLSRRPLLAFSLVYSYTKVCNMEQGIHFIRQPADLVGTPLPLS
ncbi:uncharacterized protein LY79DRAFT_347917 [Colletotrichum navitas]|uniref:Uncharacterized protein n=1 Tax=Colletotrichum navitas TaxID=681940 RepID=A0AAD8V0L7_9PEZI|nr:uncharacterized protein LY79DRAFT_347917 [Colletotrichum navitas]KAK1579246.1 hypothetical protein LY79DRAFT_347917 [Colletotrichum navitas]